MKMPRKSRVQNENVFLKIMEALEGLPPAALEQVKAFILFLKASESQRQLPLAANALAKRQVAAIKRWAGKDLGPGFSAKEHDATLYGNNR
jgi:hypothetical protein